MTLTPPTSWCSPVSWLWFAVTSLARTATAILRTTTALLDDCCCCYQLTDCDGVAPDKLVDNDLAESVDKVVDIGGVCYQVATASDCTGAITETIVATHDTCLDCSPMCYDLEDCRGAAPNLKVDNDLSESVGEAVKIGETCYAVTEAADCAGATTETIASVHGDCVQCESGGSEDDCSRCGSGPTPDTFIVTLAGLTRCICQDVLGSWTEYEGEVNGTYELTRDLSQFECRWNLAVNDGTHKRIGYLNSSCTGTPNSTEDNRFFLSIQNAGALNLRFTAAYERFVEGAFGGWFKSATVFGTSSSLTISCTHKTTLPNLGNTLESTCGDDENRQAHWGGTATFRPV